MRMLIVGDHEIVREGVKSIFSRQPDPVVFGEADDGQAALHLAAGQEWDVFWLDLSLGQRTGLELLKDLRRAQPKVPVVVMGGHDEQYVRRAFQAGTVAYVIDTSRREQIVEAVHRAVQGRRYLCPELAESLIFDISRQSEGPLHQSLSDREFEVLRLIASGKTVGEIAGMLCLSAKTISTYRARILTKMGMRSNAELTRYAVESKILG